MSVYRRIFSQAWKTTWKNRYLWFFGLFAMLLGNGGELEIIFRNFNFSLDQGIIGGLYNFAQTGIFKTETLYNIGNLMKSDPLSLIMAIGVLTTLGLIGLFLVWLTVVSQAALVNNSAKIASGKNVDFQDGVTAGMKNFWPVFGLNFAVKILIYVFFIVVSIPVISSFSSSNFTLNNLIFFIFFLLFIPLAMALSFIVKYAIANIIIKGNDLVSALRSGWDLFRANWLVSLEMAFVLFFINFMVGLCALLILLILAIPFVLIAMFFAYFSLIFNFWAVISFGLIIFFLLVIAIGALLSVFQISAWTGLYLELSGKGAVSKINRVFGAS